jgi:PAS domain S-box-containing protein
MKNSAQMDALLAEIAQLRQDKAELAREKADLELLIQATIEHSDFVEEELIENVDTLETTKKALGLEVTKLCQEIDGLCQKITQLQRDKADLEVLMELNIAHSDFIEESLLNKVESTLRESERRFRLISETIPVPMIVTLVANGEIVYANEPAGALFGISDKALLGRKITDFYPPLERNPLPEGLLVSPGPNSNSELQVQGNDHIRRWVVLFARFLTFDNQPCLLNVLYDLTERKQAEEKIRTLNEALEQRVKERTAELEQANLALTQSLETLKITQEQLIQAEKAVALTGLVAGIAHEINTPIGIGVTSSSYLEQRTREIKDLYAIGQMKRSDLESYLQAAQEATLMILRNLQRAADQIKSFKQVAVEQTISEKKPFNLKTYIENLVVSMLPKIRDTQHTITVHCPDNLEITSYPGAFSQILTHFMMNTFIHGFEHKTQGEIVLGIVREPHLLKIRYRDNGRGIEEQERLRIFDAFYTTKRGQGGTGLGLYIVYNLVTQQLKGDITCESTPGAETSFLIRIPLDEENRLQENHETT